MSTDQDQRKPSEFPQGARTSFGHRALVVVNEKVTGEQLVEALVQRLGREVEDVFVVAPAIADSGLKHMMGAVDDAVGPAHERLEATLDALHDAGLEARGEVGDSDPIQAISDEIVKYQPDQIVVVAHSEAESLFAERGLLEQAERDFDLPVLELVVSAAEQEEGVDPDVLDVKTSAPVAGRKKGWRPTGNFPPLTKRDIFGIVVAIVGTIIVALLTARGFSESNGNGSDKEEGRAGGVLAAMFLIAVGTTLMNFAHVVGLTLMQSIRYEGVTNRFFAKMTLVVTPVAVLLELLLLVIS